MIFASAVEEFADNELGKNPADRKPIIHYLAKHWHPRGRLSSQQQRMHASALAGEDMKRCVFGAPQGLPKLPNAYPQGLEFQLVDHPAHVPQCRLSKDNEWMGFSLSVHDLQNARDPAGLKDARSWNESSMEHEAEHIYHQGVEKSVCMDMVSDITPPVPEEDRKRVGNAIYLTHPGETRAHACELAYNHHLSFPGREFSVKTATRIIPGLAPGTNTAMENYIVHAADPTKQEKYRQWGIDLKGNHQVFVAMATEFTKRYNE